MSNSRHIGVLHSKTLYHQLGFSNQFSFSRSCGEQHITPWPWLYFNNCAVHKAVQRDQIGPATANIENIDNKNGKKKCKFLLPQCWCELGQTRLWLGLGSSPKSFFRLWDQFRSSSSEMWPFQNSPLECHLGKFERTWPWGLVILWPTH